MVPIKLQKPMNWEEQSIDEEAHVILRENLGLLSIICSWNIFPSFQN